MLSNTEQNCSQCESSPFLNLHSQSQVMIRIKMINNFKKYERRPNLWLNLKFNCLSYYIKEITSKIAIDFIQSKLYMKYDN